jgi:hypothetical protein
MATLDSIADEIGFSRNELMQSMVKFGLTNRDWRNEGLTAHKRLPRYQENPDMATKPPSAAQLAARKRFAEMARSGSLNRKRQIAAKKRAANPAPKRKTIQQGIDYAIKRFADSMQNLMDEGFTFDEAFQRVKAASTLGPASIKKALAMLGYATNPTGLYDNINAKRARIAAGSGERMRRPGSKGAPTDAAFKRSAMTARKSNPANATTVEAYAVICKDERLKTWHTVAIATNETDAVEIAQLLANRKKRQYAVQVRYVRAKDFEVY